MGNVWFTSDLHFGHKNIQKFRLEINSLKENEQRIISDWTQLVTKRDDIYVLGDAAFTMESASSEVISPCISSILLSCITCSAH